MKNHHYIDENTRVLHSFNCLILEKIYRLQRKINGSWKNITWCLEYDINSIDEAAKFLLWKEKDELN